MKYNFFKKLTKTALGYPVLFINFKTYKEATGKNAIVLASIAKKISVKFRKNIVIVAQPTDIGAVSKLGITVFSQHIDAVTYGSCTGFILPEAIAQAGAKGTVLNHAEHKLSDDLLEKSILRAKEAGLLVMACAETTERAKKIASFKVKPDCIAIEPPELIGGNISVSTAKPEIISGTINAVKSVADIPLITGAGIKNGLDAKKAIQLGCKGVFVASGIVKASNKKKAIEEIVLGL